MENEFYNRIVYKKNAYLELKEDLEKYYFGKKIFLLTTKSLVNSHFTDIMNSISLANCSFKHFVAKNNFSENELKTITDIISQESFDLFVVFGAGRATMVTKYFANIFCVPYIICPSACSNVCYFSNICINPYDSTRSFKCDYPERIYISDAVIKTCPRNLTKQGIFHIMALEELIAISTIENILFDRHNDYSNICSVIEKLKLMDMLIEVAFYLDNIDILKNSTFNLFSIMQKIFEYNNDFVGSGEAYLLASKTLLLCYKKFFDQKNIKQLEFPNFQKIIKNIKKYSIFYKKINNFSYFKEILSKKELIIRINNLKEEFSFQCTKRIQNQENMLSIIKLYDGIFSYETPQMSNVLSAVNVLPYICENNYVVSLLGGMGYINAF